MYVTSGDDNMIFLYDVESKKVIGKGKVSQDETAAGSKGKKFKGGASTLSTKKTHCQSRAVAFNKALNHLAVAQNDGAVTIRLVDSLEQPSDAQYIQLDTEVFRLNESNEWIECMRYSPSLTKLAVGSHDNAIYVYNATGA